MKLPYTEPDLTSYLSSDVSTKDCCCGQGGASWAPPRKRNLIEKNLFAFVKLRSQVSNCHHPPTIIRSFKGAYIWRGWGPGGVVEVQGPCLYHLPKTTTLLTWGSGFVMELPYECFVARKLHCTRFKNAEDFVGQNLLNHSHTTSWSTKYPDLYGWKSFSCSHSYLGVSQLNTMEHLHTHRIAHETITHTDLI